MSSRNRIEQSSQPLVYLRPTLPLETEVPTPERVFVEEMGVHNFRTPQEFFNMMAALCRQPKNKAHVSLTLNAHAANLAAADPAYKKILQTASILRCDGVGLMMASRMLGDPIHARLTNADYFFEMLEWLAEQNLTVFLLGAQPGVLEKVMTHIENNTRYHSIVGFHHGHINDDSELNERVKDEINALRPDVLIVGMGMPVQEFWIDRHRSELNVGLMFAVGGLFDYYVGKQIRYEWIGKLGLEWVFRLATQPRRLFKRYVIGNPWFLYRITREALKLRFSG